MADVTADYLALRQEAGWVRLPRDVIRVSGPDTAAFLQGQLSQDVARLPVGGSAWSLVLQPQGRMDAVLRVTRVGAAEFLIDVEGGFGPAVTTRLERFKLRTSCDLEALDWSAIAVRGPRSGELDVPAGAQSLPVNWPGLDGFDLLGASPEPPPEARECGLDAYQAVRIEAGVPAMGAELDDRTIPAEAGQWFVDTTVSFTKGCYTGQELVARIDSRGGNVPRRLRGVVVATNVVPPVGTEIRTAQGATVGTLTSVAESLVRRAPVALAYVQRSVEPPADVTLTWGGGETPARVENLPLVS